MILGGFEYVLCDSGWLLVVVGDCKNILGDWGWLGVIACFSKIITKSINVMVELY